MVKYSLRMCMFSQMTQCACNQHVLQEEIHNPHLQVVAIIYIIESDCRNARVNFHFSQNS